MPSDPVSDVLSLGLSGLGQTDDLKPNFIAGTSWDARSFAMVRFQSGFGPLLGRFQSAFGPLLGHFRSAFGPLSGQLTRVSQAQTDDFWSGIIGPETAIAANTECVGECRIGAVAPVV